MICTMPLWLSGIILLAIGVPTGIKVAKYDPETDFTSVEGGCKIVAVSYSIEERDHTSSGSDYSECFDIYIYTFTKTGSNTTLISAAEEHGGRSHDSDYKCDAPSSQIHPSEFAVGSTVPCWEPAPDKDISSLTSFYTCGNEGCVKLGGELSPAHEYAKAAGESRVMIIVGAVLVATSLATPLAVIVVVAMLERWPSHRRPPRPWLTSEVTMATLAHR